MALTINDELRDATLRHHISIQRLSNGIAEQMRQRLEDLETNVVSILVDRQATVEGSLDSSRLNFLLRKLKGEIQDNVSEMQAALRQELKDLSRYEASFQTRMLNNFLENEIDAPLASELNALLGEPVNGYLLKDAMKSFSDNTFNAMKAAIQSSISQDGSLEDVLASIRGTQENNFADGVMARVNNSITRTASDFSNSIVNDTASLVFDDSGEVEGEQWTATLDTSTCFECMALDGEIFKVGEGPEQPLHNGCRCTMTPVLSGVKPSSKMRFNSWLKTQDAETQDEALGPSRGLLFRKGKVSVDRFTNRKGMTLTLDQLKKKERSAFAKAGL